MTTINARFNDENQNFDLELVDGIFKITIGEFEFDFELNDLGNLLFTVARKGDLDREDGPSIDVFVNYPDEFAVAMGSPRKLTSHSA